MKPESEIDRRIALAKHEAAAAGRSAGQGAAVFALSRVIPGWAAALLVGGILAVIGAVAAAGGVQRLRVLTQPLPETRETLREDQAWAREEAREIKREIRGG